jgi:hypothetical protein
MAIRIDFEGFDREIREGRSSLVRRRIEQLLRDGDGVRDLSREDRLEIARLCRRSGIPGAGIRLLHSCVRPSPRDPVRPTAQEQAEYAACLSQIGADEEAMDLLDQLDPAQVPEALLFGAFARFARWDYRSSISILKRYVVHPRLSDYARAVGELNLASALVAEGLHSEAVPVLEKLAHESRSSGNKLIFGNAALVAAEMQIEQGFWKDAEEKLSSARDVSVQVASVDALYVEKWSAILALKKNGPSPESLQALRTVRERARARENWETIRDCDYHEALATENAAMLRQVYFGTPFVEYRKKIKATCPSTISLEGEDYWELGRNPGSREVREIDLSSLKPGMLLSRLARCLSSDFYRPFRLATIHAEIFPKRYFHPLHSPTVIHQLMRRLRAHFTKKRIPLRIRESRGSYSLISHQAVKLRIQSENSRFSELPVFERFVDHWGEGPFGRIDLQNLLKVSERSAAYLLKSAFSKGWVLKLGAGPQTRYRLTQI